MLQQRQYSAILRSTEYFTLLTHMATDIKNHAINTPNEATIESYFDCTLFSFFREVFGNLGYTYEPTKEASISTNRHITQGRADTAIGGLIIEFKQPSTLSTIDYQCRAVNQIKEYLNGIESASELIGFVTDGTQGCFITKNESGITEELFSPINAKQLDRLIQYIVKLELTTLSSQSLVDDFCNTSLREGTGVKLAKIFYEGIRSNMTQRTEMLFNEWKELFNLSHDDTSKQTAILKRRAAIEQLFEVNFSEPNEEYKALYALQTAYIIIVKLVAFRILSLVRYRESLIDFENLYHTDDYALRVQLQSLEEGSIFRQYGILNLLEGDFFSWYVYDQQWTPQITDGIRQVLSVLLRYVTRPVLNSTQKTTDFFKELYQGLIPGPVRHSLGEYYTKKWLANKVLNDTLELANIQNWRGLDPCCGSGTFITAMIDKVLDETVELSSKERLDAVLKRVVGIDLNPVAVLTARVNYFINIVPLLEEQDNIEIPIYLGDSSFVPQRVNCDNVLVWSIRLRRSKTLLKF